MKGRVLMLASAAAVVVAVAAGVAIGKVPVPAALSAELLGTNIHVASSAELIAATMVAAPGSTITLAPGDYASLTIRRRVDGRPIRIVGPRAARINQLRFQSGAAGWIVEGVTLQAAGPREYPLAILGAYDIQIANVLMTGLSDAPDARQEDTIAMRIQGSRAVSVVGSEARHVRQIAGVFETTGLIFEGNNFHEAREGLMFRNSQGIAIRHNMFVDWQPRFDLGEHPDMIQFFTQQPPYGSAMVRIIGNLFSAGQQRAVQGIFVRAESYEDGRSPLGFHRDFIIRNNIYFGSSHHGITVGSVRGVVIANNTVVASPHAFQGRTPPDNSGQTSYGWIPMITIAGCSFGRLEGNLAHRLETGGTIPPSGCDVPPTQYLNNHLYTVRSPSEASNPGNSFSAPLVAGDHPPRAFAIRRSSDAGRNGGGADAGKVGPEAASHDYPALAQEARDLMAAALAMPPPTP